MKIIDEHGNLFGLVNTVDALTVLVVLTVLTAGATLVLSGSTDESEPTEPEPLRYATVSYTTPLSSDATALDTGTTISVAGGDETFQVEDVYRSFSNSSAHVVARVSYRGTPVANGNRIYGGDTVEMTTNSYRFRGEVLSVNETATEIHQTRVPVVVRATVDDAVAQAVTSGQQVTIQNQTVARIQSVTRGSTSGNQREVRVRVEVVARYQGQAPTFGGKRLRLGRPISIVTDTFIIRGSVIEIDINASESRSQRYAAVTERPTND